MKPHVVVPLMFVAATFASAEARAQDRAQDRADACADAAQRGQELRDRGQLLEARASFRACLAPECPGVVRKDCDAYLRDVDARVPSFVVRVRTEAGDDVVPERVRLDDVALEASAWTRAVEVDPGPHVVAVEARGSVTRKSIVAREGERGRAVDVTLAVAWAKASSPRRSSRGSVVVGLLGVGAVSLASFGYFAATGVRKWNELDDGCRPNCAAGDVRDARTRLVAADVSLGVAVVAVGVAAYLFFTDPARHAPSSPSPPEARR